MHVSKICIYFFHDQNTETEWGIQRDFPSSSSQAGTTATAGSQEPSPGFVRGNRSPRPWTNLHCFPRAAARSWIRGIHVGQIPKGTTRQANKYNIKTHLFSSFSSSSVAILLVLNTFTNWHMVEWCEESQETPCYVLNARRSRQCHPLVPTVNWPRRE